MGGFGVWLAVRVWLLLFLWRRLSGSWGGSVGDWVFYDVGWMLLCWAGVIEVLKEFGGVVFTRWDVGDVDGGSTLCG